MQQALGYSPTKTGLAWLTTTMTVFVAAMAGARLAARVQVRWLLITGLSAVTAGTLWLTRVPAEASYVVDLLPAFLLVGIGFGLCGPALQIGALSGVAQTETGLASGLVETMREVGGAAGVAVVSTVLVAGSGLGRLPRTPSRSSASWPGWAWSSPLRGSPASATRRARATRRLNAGSSTSPPPDPPEIHEPHQPKEEPCPTNPSWPTWPSDSPSSTSSAPDLTHRVVAPRRRRRFGSSR